MILHYLVNVAQPPVVPNLQTALLPSNICAFSKYHVKLAIALKLYVIASKPHAPHI